MSNFIEKYIGITVIAIAFAILYYLKEKLPLDKINVSLTDFLNIFSIFAGFLTTSISLLFSIQDKKFIKIAKTSGAYQQLLKYIYTTIAYCVVSISFVIFAKLISCDIFKILSLSVCFGSFAKVVLVGFLFIKLMECNSSES
nr:MAG TPA: hypothetical protein [Caudoviricetes sp.]